MCIINTVLFRSARLFLLFLCALSVASASPARRGPRIRALCGATCDLGLLGVGEHARFITIMNDGDDTLRILSSDDSCDCFYHEFDSRTIPPGGQTNINFSLTAPETPAHFSQILRIKSNDPIQPVLRIEIEATFWRDFTLTPSLFIISDDKPCDGECRGAIEVQNTGNQAVTLDPPEVTSEEGIDVRFPLTHQVTLKRGGTMKLTFFIRVDPSVQNPHAELRMLTTAKETPILQMGVIYNRTKPAAPAQR